MHLADATVIFRALNRAEVRYFVVGGLAVAAHGYGRLTADIDLVIGLEPANITKGLRALESAGYRMAVPVTPEDFADPVQRERWRTEKGMLVLKLWSAEHRHTPVDVFVYEPFDVEQECRKASRVTLEADLDVPVVSLETLLTMKAQAGRPQDLADIEALKRLNP